MSPPPAPLTRAATAAHSRSLTRAAQAVVAAYAVKVTARVRVRPDFVVAVEISRLGERPTVSTIAAAKVRGCLSDASPVTAVDLVCAEIHAMMRGIGASMQVGLFTE